LPGLLPQDRLARDHPGESSVLRSTLGASVSSSSIPSIVATSTEREPGGPSTSDSFSFDSGSTGSNRLLIYTFVSASGGDPTSATYNGQSLTIRTFTVGQYYVAWGYLVNPPTGAHTFTLNYPSQTVPAYRVTVLQDVDQNNPNDADLNQFGTNTSPELKSRLHLVGFFVIEVEAVAEGDNA
jgi:hypothetical protein